MKTMRSLEISYDECPVDPRKDYEPMCTIASVSGKGNGYCDEVRTIEELNDIRKSDQYISKSVYNYSHSGIALSLTPFNDKFDSGILGMIYISKNKAQKEFEGETDESLRTKVIQAMEGEISVFSSYLNGDCYQGVIRVQNVIEVEGKPFYSKPEVEDSIGGIYEGKDGILSDVLSTFGYTEDDFESITVLDRKIK